ncbi:MAG: four helix bundle protein [Crocinitomicaceae bacterium]
MYIKFTEKPKSYFGVINNQIIRASGSIMDNIAEGFERSGNKEFLQYLWIAKASAGECRSQIYRAYDLSLITESEFEGFKCKTEEISRTIYGLIKSIKDSEFKGQKYK